MIDKRAIVADRSSKADNCERAEITEAKNSDEFQKIAEDGIWWFNGYLV
jgi:hypothetical protein